MQVALVLLFSLYFRDSAVLVGVRDPQASLVSSRLLVAVWRARIPVRNYKPSSTESGLQPAKSASVRKARAHQQRAGSFKLLDVRVVNSAVLSLPQLKEPGKIVHCVSIAASPLFILQSCFN